MNKPLELVQFQQLANCDLFDATVDEVGRVVALSIYNGEYDAWEDINRKAEGLKFFKHLKKLEIDVPDFSNLEAIAGLVELEELIIEDESAVEDILCLEGLIKLRRLALNNSKVTNIDALRNLNQLTYLALSGNIIKEITVLEDKVQLAELYLGYNQIGDIAPLKYLQLKRLGLENNFISDAEPLAVMLNLEYLNLNKNRVSDLQFIEKFTSLTSLHFDQNSISNISFITDLKKLQTLSFNCNLVNDISVLKELVPMQMVHLSFSGNEVSTIAPILHLKNLRHLGIGSNPLEGDVAAIGEFTNLTFLDVNGVLGEDISFFKNLTKLSILMAANNELDNVEFLAYSPQLYHLDLAGNNLTDIYPVTNLWSLSSLDLRNNRIIEPSAIAWIIKLDRVDLRGNRLDDPFNKLFTRTYWDYSPQEFEIDISEFNMQAAKYYLEQKEYDKALAHYLTPNHYSSYIDYSKKELHDPLLKIYFHKFAHTRVADEFNIKYYFFKCVNILCQKGFDRECAYVRDIITVLTHKIKATSIECDAMVEQLLTCRGYYYDGNEEYKKFMRSPGSNRPPNAEALYDLAVWSLKADQLEFCIDHYKMLRILEHPLQHPLRKAIASLIQRSFSSVEEKQKEAYKYYRAKLDNEDLTRAFDYYKEFVRPVEVARRKLEKVRLDDETLIEKLFYSFVYVVAVISSIAVIILGIKLIMIL